MAVMAVMLTALRPRVCSRVWTDVGRHGVAARCGRARATGLTACT